MKTYTVQYVFKPKDARVFPRAVNTRTVKAETEELALAVVKRGREDYEFKIISIAEAQ